MGLRPIKSFGLGLHNSSSHNWVPVKGTQVTVLILSFLFEENMNRKFGAKQPTGTPSLAWSCVVVIVSLLAGASVVHNIYKPDLVIIFLLFLFFTLVSCLIKFLTYNSRLPVSCSIKCFNFFSLQTLPPVEKIDGAIGKQHPEKWCNGICSWKFLFFPSLILVSCCITV